MTKALKLFWAIENAATSAEIWIMSAFFFLILQVAGDFLICENEIQTKSEQFYHILYTLYFS